MTTENLPQRIERFLRTGAGDFESLALELFTHQFSRNKPYQAFCTAQDASPMTVKKWEEIPAVPIAAFKSSELATFPVAQAAAVFYSSGTTQQVPSKHYLRKMNYYETALTKSFAEHVISVEAQLPFFVLTPPPGQAPRSSLSWMLEVVKRKYGASGSGTFVDRGVLLEQELLRSLHEAETSSQPVVLLGTTIVFLKFFDYLLKIGDTLHLPPGSRLMDTGGMKSEKRAITRSEFVQRVSYFLGVPADQCVNEYGMCEMSSQFYGRGASAYLEGPPWVRTLVIRPSDGKTAGTGTPGLLRHFDLANVDSVLAIQTEDVGVAEGKGFILQGRDPVAEMKGCSISAEALRT